MAITETTSSYTRIGKADPALEVLFCATCAGVIAWRGMWLESDGKRRTAVNVRTLPLEQVADLRIDHFDGLDIFEDLPADGRTVKDLWS